MFIAIINKAEAILIEAVRIVTLPSINDIQIVVSLLTSLLTTYFLLIKQSIDTSTYTGRIGRIIRYSSRSISYASPRTFDSRIVDNLDSYINVLGPLSIRLGWTEVINELPRYIIKVVKRQLLTFGPNILRSYYYCTRVNFPPILITSLL